MYDLIIIGSGPAGLSAAVYGIRAGLNLLVIEQNSMSGGQILDTYEVDNYLGFSKISGFDLGQAFRTHAEALGVSFAEARVKEIVDCKEYKLVRTRKQDYEAKAIILATGAKHARLGVPGEDRFQGMGVSYCATCDGAFYKDKTVAVVGGGDVALEDAIFLSKTCKKVYLIHRRDELRGAKILQQELLSLPNIEVLYSHEVREICGEQTVNCLQVENTKTKECRSLDADGVFIAVGIHPNSELIQDMVDCDEGGYVLAGENCATGCPGIFVAGDLRKKPLRQVVTAVADGANSVTSAGEFLRKLNEY